MAAETESGFTINGTLCEFATVFSFDLDEAQILYDNTGLTIEDFLPFGDDEEDQEKLLDEKLKNPGFVRTLMHVAYQRKHPEIPGHKVKALIGKQNLITALQDLLGEAGEDDAGPPALTNEPSESSPKETSSSPESSGDDSRKSSVERVVQLAPTTTPESDTSSTPSLPVGSVL